ncbi:hypothetical protein [Kitasatospora sp. GP82]|uniref:hypothetical protein n=1 Tax=Kitasatospora sp. GP82 TaxID=3035089 RepID=UPI0024747047|nr:hypothetical protein [Kitasatospora sp. GP82]MDH6125926.1 hypothetical protein [Kitasatospora sp. GP82]
MKLSSTQQLKHCPACRRLRPARSLGQATVRGEQLEILECSEPSCALRWCIDRRPPLGIAA